MTAAATATQTALLEAMTLLERRLSDQLTSSVSQLSGEIRVIKDTHAASLIEQERRNGEFASRISVHEVAQSVQAALLENAIRSQRIFAVETTVAAEQKRIDVIEENERTRSSDSLDRLHAGFLAAITILSSVGIAVLGHFL